MKKSGRRFTYYWDACIFLHLLSDPVKDPAVIEGIEDTIKSAERGDSVILTSIITRIEVLRAKLTDEQADRFLRLREREFVQWVNVDPRIASVAHDIRSFYVAKSPGKAPPWTPDCIHLATAIVFEVGEMHTLDGSGKRKRPIDLLTLNGNVMDGKYPLTIQKPLRPAAPFQFSPAVGDADENLDPETGQRRIFGPAPESNDDEET
jgi:predicted nucleic acid-binding protein